MDGTSLTGNALESALKDDSFAPSGYTVVGMTKASDQAKHVAFTNGGCDAWVDIPTEMIEKAEHLGDSPCKDHSHPVFRLTLAIPKDKHAAVLYALMSRTTTPAVNVSASANPVPALTYANTVSAMPYAAQSNVPMTFAAAPPRSTSASSPTALAGRLGGIGGIGGSGGLNAWGCWDSTCTECLAYEYVCNGTACWSICKVWVERPCERCIWPW